MRFTWDERKNRANQRKHGISFQTAMLVFDDPNHISAPERVVEDEVRWQTIGVVGGMWVVMVAHTVLESEEDDLIRIISARKATPRERSIYVEGV